MLYQLAIGLLMIVTIMENHHGGDIEGKVYSIYILLSIVSLYYIRKKE